MTLIADPEAVLGIQGVPGDGARFRYRVDDGPDALCIEPLEDGPGRGSLEIREGRLTLRCTGAVPRTLVATEVEDVLVRETTRTNRDVSVEGALEALRSSASLSGDVDLRRLVLGGGGAITLRIVARRAEGEIRLLEEIEDPREAALLARTIRRVLAKCG